MLYNFKIMQLYLIFACSICFTFVIGDEYLLDFPLGRVLGKTRTTITGVTLYSFQGVPFAEPPVNELRFQAPIPKEPWDGIINGTEERSYCLQMTTDNVDGDEDCLFINIFSPKDPKLNSKLPVMVYMYGGGFIEGASSDVNIGPDHLMDYDVVYVTLNYRVGPFGFFSTGDDAIPGNAGLKDQVLAMKFVNKYIQYFGGDPDKVTIFGQSAGGASVHYHVLSPQSKGLFRAAICESGSSISAWASQRNQTEISFRLVEIINPDFVNRKPSSSEVYEYLKTLPATTIDRAAHVIHKMESPSDNQIQQGFFFAPVIEHDHEDAFLTQSMYKMLQNGEFNDVKVIIGVNSEESLFYVTDEKFPNVTIAVDSDNTILVPRSLNAKESDHAAIAQKIKDFYSPYLNFTGNWRSLIKYFSDQSFARSLIKSAELQSRWADVYFYEFQYHGVLGGFTNDPVIGFSDDCRHGEETSYILRRNYGGLNTTDLSKYPEIDQTVQKRIIRMWTDFAKYLNPTPEPIDLLQNITWPTVKPNDFQYLAIGAWLEVRKNPKEDMYRFWEQIFSSYGTEPFTSY
ncbi:unnamed protein product [Psylliodes chrysocephalus]|uniref:Carboxylic ester hydrolase n=1 Tax=Psylliodes chrysocephalus TaxID=3402493 RepID=A0A9P0DEQ0_9CUCU|nr:unnamed protein product [Psylliodes chrysocephala]